jgi:hypothetical protein
MAVAVSRPQDLGTLGIRSGARLRHSTPRGGKAVGRRRRLGRRGSARVVLVWVHLRYKRVTEEDALGALVVAVSG